MSKRGASTAKSRSVAQARAETSQVAAASGWPEEWIHELIQRGAHQHFEWRGRQPGLELDHWLQAEHETKLQMKYHGVEASSVAELSNY